jgi:hypothetical protein
MSFPEGKIGYNPRNVLNVEGEIIESSTIRPIDLYDFVTASSDIIAAHVEYLYKKDLLNKHNPATLERSVIHATRLALSEWDRTVFNTFDMGRIHTINKDPQVLLHSVREYWEAIEATPFVPEVHIRSIKATKGTSGVWLSLRTNKQQ